LPGASARFFIGRPFIDRLAAGTASGCLEWA